MIEYALARPFIVLSVLSTVIYTLTIALLNSPIGIKFTAFIFFLLNTIICLVFRKYFKLIILLSVCILCFSSRAFFHLKTKHKEIINTELRLNNQLMLVENDVKTKTHRLITAKINLGNNIIYSRIKFPLCSFKNKLYYGDSIKSNLTLQAIPSFHSNYFTNFNAYLIVNHIRYTGWADDPITTCALQKFNLLNFSQKTADQIKATLLKYVPDSSNAYLLISLLIGDKQNLDINIKNEFISSGTAHILAVSGLHLGIIYFLILQILSIFKRYSLLNQAVYAFVIIMLCIWFFAFITGLGASIVRSAIMLSLLEFGKTLGRSSTPVNTLCSCAFIMLSYDPCTLYDIGFQLSFIAVLSILLFDPYIKRLWIPESFIASKLRDLVSISISVQILTAPLSIYYFNQFPIYFLVSNLIWIPLSFILMMCGIAIIFFSHFLPLLSHYTGAFSSELCNLGLLGFKFIKILPFSTLDQISLFPEQLLCQLLSSILLFFWIHLKQSIYLKLSAIFILALPLSFASRLIKMLHSNELIITAENKTIQTHLRVSRTMFTSNVKSHYMDKYNQANFIEQIYPIKNTDHLSWLMKQNQMGDYRFEYYQSMDQHGLFFIDCSRNTDCINIVSRIPKSKSKNQDTNQHPMNCPVYNLQKFGPFTLSINVYEKKQH